MPAQAVPYVHTSSGGWVSLHLYRQSWSKNPSLHLTTEQRKEGRSLQKERQEKLYFFTWALSYGVFCFPVLSLPASCFKSIKDLFNSSNRAVEEIFVALGWSKGDWRWWGSFASHILLNGDSQYFVLNSRLRKNHLWLGFVFSSFALFQEKGNRWVFLFNRM